jgi:hypothetical protein
MRALTQGCENGGDVRLSHIGANGGSRFGDIWWAQFLSTMRGVVVVAEVEEEEWESGKDKEEVGRSRKWKERALAWFFAAFYRRWPVLLSHSWALFRSHDYDSSTLIGPLDSSDRLTQIVSSTSSHS